MVSFWRAGVSQKAMALALEFSGALGYWRDPAPHSFVTMPEEHCAALNGVAGLVTYGCGMIPVRVRVGDAEWKTSLCPTGARPQC